MSPDSQAGLNYEQAHLVKMINQIAANVPNRSAVAEQVAAHLRSFWTPEMRRDIQAIGDDYPEALIPEARDALGFLWRS